QNCAWGGEFHRDIGPADDAGDGDWARTISSCDGPAAWEVCDAALGGALPREGISPAFYEGAISNLLYGVRNHCDGGRGLRCRPTQTATKRTGPPAVE